MTVEGAKRLKAELHRLKTVDRPAVIAAIAEARSHGDLAGERRLRRGEGAAGLHRGPDRRGRAPSSRSAQVINPAEIDADGRVVFGATVELADVETGDHVTYQIVGDDEADIKHGKISVSSPIARALIGKTRQGDTAEVHAPGGVREYEVLAVRYA